MWREESRLGMQAFVNGDNEQAIRRWQRSIALAEESHQSLEAELGETYYNLGKVLADLEKSQQAISYLEKSIWVLEAVAPNHQRLATARYQLAALLRKAGLEREAERFTGQGSPSPTVESIPLQKALAALKQCELAQDLTGKVLNELCRATGIDLAGSNRDIADLLLAYYSSATDGGRRQKQDRFFASHYTDFDVPSVLALLGQLSGRPQLLSLVGTKGSTADGKDFLTIELRREDGELIHRACTSIVGLVDCFNEQLKATNIDLCFYSLDVNDVFCCYLLKESTFLYLAENRILPFDDYYLSASGLTEEPAPELSIPEPDRASAVAEESEDTSRYLQQILAIQEVLPQIPVKELPSILIGLRRLRTALEKSSAYEYSASEEEAFERVVATLARQARAAKINRQGPAEEPAVEVSRFGGRPYAEAEDQWPECPHCSLSLNFLGQISEELYFDDSSIHRLLFTIFYCFSCRPQVTASDEGYVIGVYWDASRSKFAPILPQKALSQPVSATSYGSVWLRPLSYLPAIREVELASLGVPEDYYRWQFERQIEAVREVADIIEEGPYPQSAKFLNCEDCGQPLKTRYTLYLDGAFTILACPHHPDRPLGFHQD